MYIVFWYNRYRDAMTRDFGSLEYIQMYFAGIAYEEFTEWAKTAQIGDSTVLKVHYGVVKVA